ncbi:substrate-binding domain-containing protein, partial [Paenibacillus ihuae]
MKKVSLMMLTLALMLMMSACSNGNGSGGSEGKEGKVGIAMPTKSSERWVNDGNNMVKEFEALGYGTDLQYAEDVVENQVSQIENMITKGVKALVIASIDGEALTDVLQKAHDAGVKVIAYDRLIKKSEYVDYYATFDNFKVGVLQGSYIEEKL